jgi:hypothetical protein
MVPSQFGVKFGKLTGNELGRFYGKQLLKIAKIAKTLAN